MELEVVRVLLVADAREVEEQVLVHLRRERLRRESLVVDRSVEGDSLVDDVKGLR